MRLVTVAHGTRNAAGNRVAADIARRAGARLGTPAQAAYVELCQPLFADVVAGAGEPVVAVPLLLSRGFHVGSDLPEALGGAGGEVALAPALGPHRLLARAQAVRLREAGAEPGDPVVMVAAGSLDPRAGEDVAEAAVLLADVWGAAVRVAVLSGEGPRITDVVAPGDAVSLYLLSPGYFATRAAADARDAGARVVADVLGAHDLVVDLVVERARAAGLTPAAVGTGRP